MEYTYCLTNVTDPKICHTIPPPLWTGQGWLSLWRGQGWLLAPGKGGGDKSEFDFPPVLYVDLPLYGMTYTLAVQVVQRQ